MKFELSCGGMRAVADSRGGELISLQDAQGTQYIWNGDPAFWAGRNPLLFPIVGNLKNGEVQIRGQACRMGRHGFAREMEFSPVRQDDRQVVLELRESPKTLQCYPFAFSLRVTHTLNEDGFTTAFEVRNTGHAPMPFCIGAHTAFCCPIHPGERFEDYRLVFDRPEHAQTLLLTADGLVKHGCTWPMLKEEDSFSLDRSVFERLDTIILEDLRSSGVGLYHRETGRGLHVDFGGFPMVAFWTKSGCEAPFICIEPWHGCAALDNESGEFSDKPYCITLPAGQSMHLSYTVTVG